MAGSDLAPEQIIDLAGRGRNGYGHGREAGQLPPGDQASSHLGLANIERGLHGDPAGLLATSNGAGLRYFILPAYPYHRGVRGAVLGMPILIPQHILGFPHETEETVAETLRLAKHFDPDMAHFLCITPWPYAELWDEMKDRVRVHDYAKYNLIDPIVEPEAMNLRDLDSAIVRCYRDFYMGKMKDFMSYPDEFRRRYMLSSMKLIMKSSFLVEKIGRLAMPPGMSKMMAAMGKKSG